MFTSTSRIIQLMMTLGIITTCAAFHSKFVHHKYSEVAFTSFPKPVNSRSFNTRQSAFSTKKYPHMKHLRTVKGCFFRLSFDNCNARDGEDLAFLTQHHKDEKGKVKHLEGNLIENSRKQHIPNRHETSVMGRRRWIRDMIISSVAKSTMTAHASDFFTLSSTDKSTSTSEPAICDLTIDSYRKGSKQIHIVGTAHVSSVSAQLSGSVVKEMKPDAVFIELDPQRLSRAFRNGKISRPTTIVFFSGEDPVGGGKVTLQSAILPPQDLEKRSLGIFQFLEKLTMKNPIQKMYEGLESQGITPGEEFITAVEEGTNLGSIIILGDRQMDITLRRLAKALLLHTDPQKLIEADRRITSKMVNRMPELKEWEDEMKQNGETPKELSPEKFAFFVERMKTKETTMEFMQEIQTAAPALYGALVGERDVFMGRAMDTLFSSSSSLSLGSNNPIMERMVSVVGLGHMQGIGKELKSLGWIHFVPSQCSH